MLEKEKEALYDGLIDKAREGTKLLVEEREREGGVVVRGMEGEDWDFLVGLCDEEVRGGYEKGKRREEGCFSEVTMDTRAEMDAFTNRCFSSTPPW